VLLPIVLWVTIVYLLQAVGYALDSWQFWCFLGTYWAMNQIGSFQGKVEGIIDFLNMSEEDQRKLKEQLKDVNGEAK